MIVPFLFNLDEYSKEKPTHMVCANKSLDFCLKNKAPFIAQERFVKKPSYYIERKHSAFTEKNKKDFQYKILSDKEFDSIDIEVITKNDEKKIVSKYKNIREACNQLLVEENNDFESIIESKILNIEKKYKEKIEAIIAWFSYPSLLKVAKRHNIKVINYESSTIRPGKYRDYLFYFSFGSKYNNINVWEDFKKFKDNSKSYLMLNKKELISLFINDEHIPFINETDKNPDYEVGVALGLKKDCFVKAFDKYDYNTILKKLEKIVSPQKISVRSHPAMPIDEKKYDYSFDHSFESIEWITKCKSIVCQVSNIGYEAILFDRGIISTNANMVTSFGKESSLEYYDPTYYGIKEVNFLTFAYYVPLELCFDINYIRYRLKEKNIMKVYEYNINYILKKYGINPKKLQKMDLKERFISILNTHNITEEEKQKIIRDAFEVNRYNELDREKDKLIICKEEQLNLIKNSKGWKLLERLRKIKPGN